MLNMKFTRIFNTESRAVLSVSVIPEEGMALVEAIEGGESKTTLSKGVPGEIFAGISMSRNAPPAVLPNVENGVVPASLQVKLARVPSLNQLLVKANNVALTIVAGVPAAGEVKLSNDVLTFNAAQAGEALIAQYLYAPTLVEARSIVGDYPIGGLASTAQHVIGVLIRGEFATNMFDASVDWSNALRVNLGADGFFTVGGNGTELANVVIRNRPSSANSMLVLAIN
jgi:hypothetical protein